MLNAPTMLMSNAAIICSPQLAEQQTFIVTIYHCAKCWSVYWVKWTAREVNDLQWVKLLNRFIFCEISLTSKWHHFGVSNTALQNSRHPSWMYFWKALSKLYWRIQSTNTWQSIPLGEPCTYKQQPCEAKHIHLKFISNVILTILCTFKY